MESSYYAWWDPSMGGAPSLYGTHLFYPLPMTLADQHLRRPCPFYPCPFCHFPGPGTSEVPPIMPFFQNVQGLSYPQIFWGQESLSSPEEGDFQEDQGLCYEADEEEAASQGQGPCAYPYSTEGTLTLSTEEPEFDPAYPPYYSEAYHYPPPSIESFEGNRNRDTSLPPGGWGPYPYTYPVRGPSTRSGIQDKPADREFDPAGDRNTNTPLTPGGWGRGPYPYTYPAIRGPSTRSGIPLTEGNHCKLCRSNRESEVIFMSHTLRDQDGKVQCPVLRAHTCPLCGETGDNGHTIKYCPLNEDVPPHLRSKTFVEAKAITAKGILVKRAPSAGPGPDPDTDTTLGKEPLNDDKGATDPATDPVDLVVKRGPSADPTLEKEPLNDDQVPTDRESETDPVAAPFKALNLNLSAAAPEFVPKPSSETEACYDEGPTPTPDPKGPTPDNYSSGLDFLSQDSNCPLLLRPERAYTPYRKVRNAVGALRTLKY